MALKVIRADRYNQAFNQRAACATQREIDKDILIEQLLAAKNKLLRHHPGSDLQCLPLSLNCLPVLAAEH